MKDLLRYCAALPICSRAWMAALVTLIAGPALAQLPGKPGQAVKLDTIVNSPFEEIMPLMASDMHTLYFVRSLSPANNGGKEGGQDVWYSVRDEQGKFSAPVSLGLPVDNASNNAICGISLEGNTIYLTNVYGKKRMEPGVSFSRKEANGWSQPQALEIDGLTIQRGYLGAYMCPDEKTLLLTMKSDDAVGREDIYVSFRQADGRFSKPLSLGKGVNTVGFEISPYYKAADSTLYFASNGLEGYGDADIFRAKRLDPSWTKWSKPENLGPQVNSDGFDAYLSFAQDSTAYFVKEDPEQRFADIYTVIVQDPTANKEASDSTLANARKKAAADAAKKAGKKGGKKGNNLNGDEDDGTNPNDPKNRLTDKDPRAPEEIFRELAGRKRKSNSDFESILFDFGSSKLRPEGKRILDKAIKYLADHPAQAIEMVGHTDSVSGDLVNQILSDKRSYATKEYLMRKGISRNRILTHGFGKQIYVEDNLTERSRQLNRRCEINLLIDPDEFRQYYQKEGVVIPPAGK